MVLTSTCAVAPTALAVVHGNGATAEIAQVLHLAEQVFSTRLQLQQRLIHSAPNLNDYTHSDYRPKKERAQLLPTNLTRTYAAGARRQTRADGAVSNYDLAPHGKHLAAILAPDETKLMVTHLTFLLNFFDKLNRRVPEGKK